MDKSWKKLCNSRLFLSIEQILYGRRHRVCSLFLLVLSFLGIGQHVCFAASSTLPRYEIQVAPQYAYWVFHSRSQPKGMGASLQLLYNLSPSMGIRIRSSWTVHEVELKDLPQHSMHVLTATAGVRYLFDIVNWSPGIEAGFGMASTQQPQTTDINGVFEFGVSLDYFVRKWISVGAAFHYYAFVTNPQQYPVYFDAGPRIGVCW